MNYSFDLRYIVYTQVKYGQAVYNGNYNFETFKDWCKRKSFERKIPNVPETIIVDISNGTFRRDTSKFKE
ncbi:hypothetical protein LCGC14_0370460 [marine sediment metagenome]|uniref:Uncharacterized protein n=1 Tax=marine sediment metagenome TaxID=412755 RepID=A0A0F9T584_9ZZZZ